MSKVFSYRLTSTFLAFVISAAILWWLLRDGAGQALLAAFAHARVWPFIFAFVLVVLIQFARAWRFAIMESGRLALPSFAMFDIATRLILFNYLLPFKLGELSFPVMMKQTFDTPLLRSTGMLILARLLDFGVVGALFLLAFASLALPGRPAGEALLAALGGLLALLLPFLLLDGLSLAHQKVQQWPRIDRYVDPLISGARRILPWRQRSAVFLLTLVVWTCHGLIAFLTAAGIGAAIGLVKLFMASAAANVAFALPINGVAGLGPPQAAWAGVLHLVAVPWEPAVATALACQALLLLSVLVLGLTTGLIRIWRKTPARAGRAQKNGQVL